MNVANFFGQFFPPFCRWRNGARLRSGRRPIDGIRLRSQHVSCRCSLNRQIGHSLAAATFIRRFSPPFFLPRGGRLTSPQLPNWVTRNAVTEGLLRGGPIIVARWDFTLFGIAANPALIPSFRFSTRVSTRRSFGGGDVLSVAAIGTGIGLRGCRRHRRCLLHLSGKEVSPSGFEGVELSLELVIPAPFYVPLGFLSHRGPLILPILHVDGPLFDPPALECRRLAFQSCEHIPESVDRCLGRLPGVVFRGLFVGFWAGGRSEMLASNNSPCAFQSPPARGGWNSIRAACRTLGCRFERRARWQAGLAPIVNCTIRFPQRRSCRTGRPFPT